MSNRYSVPLPSFGKRTLLQKGTRALIMKGLNQLKVGTLIVVEHFVDTSPQTLVFGTEQTTLRAELHIYDGGFYERLFRGGSIGAAEAYIDGLWDSPDLTALVELVARNQRMLDTMEHQSGHVRQWLSRIGHWLKRNTIDQARRNIIAHYDLGNQLYATFLDHQMLYSCGLYRADSDTLEQAQINKMQRLCDQLALTEDDQVLEIGCGWGALAIYMAQNYGCHVTTTTVSGEQYAYVLKKIEQAGLEAHITLLNKDYRLLEGQFDKIVSVEMVEAVGQQYLPGYLKQCQARLNPGGKLVLQAITIADQRYDYYSHHVDFIQKYIFPGGFLPSVTALTQAATRYSDFVVRDLYDFGTDYAKTLHAWRQRFEQQIEHILTLGYDERFIRLWRFYFSYCEGGFRARTISVMQMTLIRPM